MADTSTNIFSHAAPAPSDGGLKGLIKKGNGLTSSVSLAVSMFVGAIGEYDGTAKLIKLATAFTFTNAVATPLCVVYSMNNSAVQYHDMSPTTVCPSGTALAAPYLSEASNQGSVYWLETDDILYLRNMANAEANAGALLTINNGDGQLKAGTDAGEYKFMVMAYRAAEGAANGVWTLVRYLGPHDKGA